MSSMFKKKGGLAFKPKVPAARPRPVNAPSAPAPKSVESRPPGPPSLDAASNDAFTAPGSPLRPSDGPLSASQTAVSSQQTLPPPRASQTTTGNQPQPDFPSENPAQVHKKILRKSNTSGRNKIIQAGGTLQPATDSASAPAQTHSNQASAASPACPPRTLTDATPEEHEPPPESSSLSTLSVGAAQHPDVPASLPPAASPASDRLASPGQRRSKRALATKKKKASGEGTKPPPNSQQRKAALRDSDAAPRPRTRRRKHTNVGEADEADETNEDGSEPKKKPRRGRSPTPEDAEDQVVDLQQLKMADLTRDLRIGKKFSRHDELRDRERKARMKFKLPKDGDQVDKEASGSASPAPAKPDGQANAASSSTATFSAPPAVSGPQFRIVDGQIILDQSSLFMDRHARATAAQAGENMETIEENDFTRLITSSSFSTSSKLKGPNIWTDEETELFYRGLRMFGTEFEMISKMFPGKQRRHVKLKFNREERHNPKRIDEALMGEKTIKLDIDEYRAFTGAEFELVETIEAEQRKVQEAYEQERQRLADEQAETMRKKREELFAEDDGGGDNNAAGGRSKGSRKGKQVVAYGLNGEPIAQGA